MSRAWVSVGLAAAALAGCAHYTPQPPTPERFPAALDARQLNPTVAGSGWTPADLMSAALTRNPQIAEARAKYAVALAAARTARLSPGLTLTLTAEYADERPRWGGGGALDLPLETRVRRGARMTAADLQALQAWYDYGEVLWAVRTALKTAQADLEAARREGSLAQALSADRTRRRALLEARVAAGEDERAQALAAFAQATAAEQRLADARSREAQASLALARAVGVGPDGVRSLTLATAPNDGGPVEPDRLARWRREAALSRSDVLRAIADYDLAETALRLEIGRQYPEVRLGPAYNYDHGINKLPFALSLALPSYDLNRRAIIQAEAARAAAGRSLEQVQASTLARVDAAATALAAARETVQRVATQDLPAAERAERNTTRAVSAGAADRVDAVAAEAAILDARLSLVDAERALRTASIELEDALRRPSDPAEAAVLQQAMTRPGDAP